MNRGRLIILILFLSWNPCRGGSGGPDSFGYRWVDSSEPGGPAYQWTEIRSLGYSPGWGDEQSWRVALPGTFLYYGVPCDSVYVCSNGYLSFSSPEASAYPTSIPNSDPPNGLAAPLWNDLDPSDPASGDIYCYYDTLGNKYTVEWDSIVHFGTQHFYSIQAVLDLSDYSLTFLYRSAWPGWQSDAASTGIEDHDGVAGLGIPGGNLANQYAVRFTAQPDTHDLQAVRITAPGWQVEPDSLAVPEMMVANAGLVEESFPVVCRIIRNDTVIYSETSMVTGLQPGDSTAVGFQPWLTGPADERYYVLIYSDHKDDQNRKNDTLTSETVSFSFRNKVNSQWKQGIVIIDGVMSPGEWPEEGQVDISDILGKKGTAFLPGSARLYAQNDSAFLYLALDATGDMSLNAGDSWTVWIDDGGDGGWEGDESEGGYHLEYSTIDSLLFFPMPSGTPVTAPGVLRASSAGSGRLQRELAIPLGTANAWDLAQSPGGTCRTQVSAVNGTGNISYAWWPQDVETWEEPEPVRYGSIFLANHASGMAGGPSETPVSPLFKLHQNNPSPFGQYTKINYQLSKPGLASLKVYNINGQLVRTLFHGQQSSGPQQVIWDAKDEAGRKISEGVYIYKLSFGTFSQSRKMVLIK